MIVFFRDWIERERKKTHCSGSRWRTCCWAPCPAWPPDTGRWLQPESRAADAAASAPATASRSRRSGRCCPGAWAQVRPHLAQLAAISTHTLFFYINFFWKCIIRKPICSTRLIKRLNDIRLYFQPLKTSPYLRHLSQLTFILKWTFRNRQEN